MSVNWGNSDAISLSQYLRILNARKALIFTIFFLVMLTTVLFTLFLPRWYRSTATVKVEKPEGEVSLFRANSQTYFDPFFTLEQLEILKSKKILFQVIENEELNLRERLGEQIAGAADLSVNEAYAYLYHAMLEVENSKQGTALIDIHVEAQEDPLLAADVANAIAYLYAEDRVAFAVSSQTEGIERLKKELLEQEKRVSEHRDKVEALRKEFKLSGIDINVDSLAQEIENLKVLEKTLITMRVDAIGRKSRWENFKSIPQEERLNLVNSELITDPNIQNLLQAYMVAEQQHSQIEGQLGDEHPDLLSSLENLKTIRTQLDSLLSGYEKALEISNSEIQAQVAELESQLGEARLEQIKSAQSKMRPFEEAVEKLREEEQIYQTLKLTLRQREIDFQVPKKSIEILNPAEPSSRPSKPSWVINILLAMIVGTTLGVGVALLIEYFDTSFRSVEDIEQALDLPILGVVAKSAVLVTKDNYSSGASEAYRVIQTNLELAGDSDQKKVFAIQSAGPGEGKSTTLQNLARVIALSGQRVLVIDTDLRRPTQHKILELNREPGFGELLSGKKKEEDVIRSTGIPGLDIITSGHGQHSLSVLHAKRLRALVETLKEKYDKILFDSPPVIGVSDASVLASIVDGVALVVQHRRNPQSMTRRAKDIIQKSEGNLLGIVLNQVPTGGVADYNYYTSNYAYYGDSSGESRPTRKKDTTPSTDEDEQFRLVE